MAEKVAVFRDKKLRNFLKKMDKNASKIKGRHRDFVVLLSSLVFQDIDDHFRKEQGPKGKWKKWSSSYASFMDKIGKSGNLILQDSGRMRMSNIPIEKGKQWRKISNGILWFNPAKTKSGFPYAAHHDDGKSDGRNPRPFMWLSDKAMGKIAKQTNKFMLEGK